MGFREKLEAAMLRLIQDRYDKNATEVVEYRERTIVDTSGCETCGPDYDYYTEIVYRVKGSQWPVARRYEGLFGDLMRDLDGYSED